MNNKRIKLNVVLLMGLGLSGLQAQESINVTGGNASGSGGLASYSIGQVTYQTHYGINGSVLQGVQQAYEIYVLNEVNDVFGVNLIISAYPNPTTDYLTLEVDFSTMSDIKKMSYQLFDIQGKLLQNEKIFDSKTKIDMKDLVPANYFIKVIQNNQEVKQFKVIKTQ